MKFRSYAVSVPITVFVTKKVLATSEAAAIEAVEDLDFSMKKIVSDGCVGFVAPEDMTASTIDPDYDLVEVVETDMGIY